FVIKFLYRSLLRYNSTTKQMEGDLVTCDLGENFSKIKCFLKKDSKWSDGTVLKKEDIFKTYDLLRNTDTNIFYKKLLANLEITDKGDFIEFNTKNPDTFVIDAFFFPILPASQIDQIKDSKIKPEDYITTGYYKYLKKEVDSTTNSKDVTVVRNDTLAPKDVYMGKYIFKFFNSSQELIDNQDTLGIIYSPSGLDIKNPKLEEYSYLLPQYIALFLNYDKIKEPLRKIILSSIQYDKLKSLDTNKGKIIKNPFFGEQDITPELKNKDLNTTLEGLGYFKKEKLLANVDKNVEDTYKKEKKLGIPKSNYIYAPTNEQMIFINGQGETILKGKTSDGIQAVYINDNKLADFDATNKEFTYKISFDLKNLLEGENYYKLTFEKDGNKQVVETIKIVCFKDDKKLEELKKKALEIYTTKFTDQEKQELQKKKNEELKKINALENNLYYDKNYNNLSLNFSYSIDNDYLATIAKETKDTLTNLGITVNSKEITTDDLKVIIGEGKKDYDLLLTGINIGTLSYNITPFFHSSQAKIGFNFSKLRSPGIDPLLEELKSKQFSQEKLEEMKGQINKILKEEAIVKTFYSPYNHYYINRGLENTKKSEIMPYNYYLYYAIENSYNKTKRSINFKDKSIKGFLDWAKNQVLK
ncbi:MAG: hypothetical protein PHF26_02880, partial [Candidatus Gracilibacteria bacterium]|nr:hypothetical protein [Candidatus Gracilibacteria bacterium]